MPVHKQLFVLSLALMAAPTPLARAADTPQKSLQFLLGKWKGSGSGAPGQGAGSFSFEPDLQGRVLVRRAHTEYPAANGRPAAVHDDLMIVYADQSRAVYFDNEGHVIHYAVQVAADGREATFTSTDPLPAPLFRLTYKQLSPGELNVAFAIAPSGKASDLKQYVSGSVKRSDPPAP